MVDLKSKVSRPVTLKKTENCLVCSSFIKCKDSNKAFNYKCKLFTSRDSAAVDLDSFTKTTKDDDIANFASKVNKHVKRKIKKFSIDNVDSDIDPEEFNVLKLINSFKDSTNPNAINLKIDDRDLPGSPNFISFMLETFGAQGQEPWAKQIEIGSHFFGDFCLNPKCTDTRYITDIPVKDSVDTVLSRVTFLEFGKCPKCQKTRADFWKSKVQKNYHEFVALFGMRSGKCVRGDTIVPTNNGLVEIQDFNRKEYSMGFNKLNNSKISLEDGALAKASHFYKEELAKTITVTMKDGKSLTGTYNHPIMTHRGWVRLADLTEGEAIPVHIGQDCWATKVPSLKRVAELTRKQMSIHDDKKVTNSRGGKYKDIGPLYEGKLTPAIARLLGFLVSEGTGGRDIEKHCNIQVTTTDQSILYDCALTLSKLFGVCDPRTLIKAKLRVDYSGLVGFKYFNNLLVKGDVSNLSAEREVPKIILRSPKPLVVEFLRALFEGDGYVITKGGVEYLSISKKLVYQVNIMLSNLGIASRIYTKPTWTTNGTKTAYLVAIEGAKVLTKFQEEIGFISERKNKALAASIKHYVDSQVNTPFWYEKYPEEIKREFIQFLEQMDREFRLHPNPYAKRNLNIRSVLGQNHEFNRISSDNVALSNRSILRVIHDIGDNTKYLSQDSLKKLEYWADLATNDNFYYTTVDKVKRNKKKELTYDFNIPKHHKFMANGLLNHNSSLTAMMFAYQLQRLIKMGVPAKIYPGILSSTTLVATFVAVAFKQARENLYDPFNKMVSISPWYLEYHKLLDYYGTKYGDELYKFRDTFLLYKPSNLHIFPSTNSDKTLRGYTRFGCATDELGFIFAKDKSATKLNPDMIIDALRRSTLTMRAGAEYLHDKGQYDIPNVIICNISSPSSITDKICRLYEESKESDTMLGYHKSVFEVNPIINEKTLANEKRSDPVAYRRDYLAIPPRATNIYLPSKQVLKVAIGKHRNAIHIKQSDGESASGMPITFATAKFSWKNDKFPRVLALDTGLADNSFSGCVSHFDEEEQLTVVDSFFEIIPQRKRPVNFNNIYIDVLRPVVEKLNVKYLVCDRWNSAKILDDLEAEFECGYEYVRLVWEDFVAVKNAFINNEIVLPKPEITISEAMNLAPKNYPFCMEEKPVAHFMVQILTVEEMMGKTVVKGDKRTDDLFRTLCLSYYAVNSEEIRDNYLNVEVEPPKVSNLDSMIVYGSYGSGGSQSNRKNSQSQNQGQSASFVSSSYGSGSSRGNGKGGGRTFGGT